MHEVFDFLARLGEVMVGLIGLVGLVILVILLIIEAVDWLIVDPIANRRAENSSTDKTSKED